MNDEIDERAQLIYDLINNRYCLEWKRISDLDGKASNVIGFIGIILSLYAGLGSFLLDKIRTNEFYIYFFVIFLVGIILLMCSILYGLKTYNIKEWTVVPNPDYLIEHYAKKEDINRLVILENVTVEFSKAVIHNKEINDRKAKFITHGFIFLGLGITMVILFVSCLLLIK